MEQILDLINEMSPYLLLGFFLAGLMHAFIPGTLYSKYLSKVNFRSVIYAAMLGIPLPLCSCGVIPTAMSLRREGASKGATVSFLIATPQTGVDSIIATFSLMGLPFAIVRPIAALVTALFGGQMVNMVEGKEGEDHATKEEDHATKSHG
ncbi:MAG: permease, partial [Prevotella sp.]|nr:permease [Prevotella sp.]